MQKELQDKLTKVKSDNLIVGAQLGKQRTSWMSRLYDEICLLSEEQNMKEIKPIRTLR